MKCMRVAFQAFFLVFSGGILLLGLPQNPYAQANPCAPRGSQNPCAVTNPCAPRPGKAAQNPCAVVNPCAPGGQAAAAIGRAITARGEIAKVDSKSGRLVLKSQGKQIDLKASKYMVVRDGPKVKPLKGLKAGEKVTVSYVDTGKDRTAWYVYLASAALAANPCAANPCAVRNPCAPANPCAANPCAPKAKRAVKNPCAAANPCAVSNPCAPKSGKTR